MIKQSMVFVRGDPHDKAAFLSQVPDWSRAGIPRIFLGFASAIALHLEDILPNVQGRCDDHPHRARPTQHARVASSLAEANGARLVLMPGVSHSWPKADSARFLRFINEVVS
ncbi:MAG TPA: hypothetical protein VHR39_13445 [Propionibacteriaceae bacterium]|jgi:hypothetical protein|nr:hypothetical protein [Propionibacteriaceae bacterium]